MKVVLKRDVKNMGRANETVTVADGHALNFLIPKGYAVSATGANLKEAGNRQKAVEDRKALDVKLVEERLAALAEGKVTIIKKANEQGSLYDGVDAAEIAQAATIPLEAIRLQKPLKEIGTHDIPVAFGASMGKFTLEIVAE